MVCRPTPKYYVANRPTWGLARDSPGPLPQLIEELVMVVDTMAFASPTPDLFVGGHPAEERDESER